MPMSRLLASHEQEFTRLTRSSRLMPVTRGRSPTWGNDRMASLGGRHGSVQDQEDRELQVYRRRQERRLASMPDPRQVDQSREVERERGGPPAPHNSLDVSVINLSETGAIDEEPEVFYNNPIPSPPNDNLNDDDLAAVPPLDPTEARAMLDSALARRSGHNTTIDLTDSPIRPSSPLTTPPSSTSPEPLSTVNLTQSPSTSSLKCPVCLETFTSIRKRGSRLVSTVCGHMFCGKCLPPCVRTNGHCPTCRRSLGCTDFHPLLVFSQLCGNQ